MGLRTPTLALSISSQRLPINFLAFTQSIEGGGRIHALHRICVGYIRDCATQNLEITQLLHPKWLLSTERRLSRALGAALGLLPDPTITL